MADTAGAKPMQQKQYPSRKDPLLASYRRDRISDRKGNTRRRYILCPDPKCGYPLVLADKAMHAPGFGGEKQYVCLYAGAAHLSGERPMSQEQYDELRDMQGG